MFSIIQSCCNGCRSKKADFQRDDFSEWSKPPPLENISVELSEIMSSSIIVQMCYFLHVVTMIIAAMLLSINIYLTIIPCSMAPVIEEDVGLFNNLRYVLPMIVSRVFNIGFCLIIIFQEQQFSFLLKFTTLFESWLNRGLFILYCASVHLITISACHPCAWDRISTMVGCALAVIGLVYFLLGCLCFRQLQSRLLNQIRKRKQAQMQAKKLSDHKDEIERLLEQKQNEKV